MFGKLRAYLAEEKLFTLATQYGVQFPYTSWYDISAIIRHVHVKA